MSNRATGRNAFENLKPTIVRQPNRKEISPDAEALVFDKPLQGTREAPTESSFVMPQPALTPAVPAGPTPPIAAVATAPTTAQQLQADPDPVRARPSSDVMSAAAPANLDTFSSGRLLTKKKREVLIPVTFRIRQSLKAQLEWVAEQREVNQSELINEGIELNLKRYLGQLKNE